MAPAKKNDKIKYNPERVWAKEVEESELEQVYGWLLRQVIN